MDDKPVAAILKKLAVLAAILVLLGIALAIYASDNGAEEQPAGPLLDVSGYCTVTSCSLILNNYGETTLYVSQINITQGNTTITLYIEPTLPVPPMSYGTANISFANGRLETRYSVGSHNYVFHEKNQATTLSSPEETLFSTVNYTISNCNQLVPLELDQLRLFVNQTHAYYVVVNISTHTSILWIDSKLLYMHDLSAWETFSLNSGEHYETLLPLQDMPLWRTSNVPSPATRIALSLYIQPDSTGACRGWVEFKLYRTAPVEISVGLADGSRVIDFVPLIRGSTG